MGLYRTLFRNLGKVFAPGGFPQAETCAECGHPKDMHYINDRRRYCREDKCECMVKWSIWSMD